MPHFFISTSDLNQDIITVSDKDNFHHIVKVLRSKVGETLLFIDENRIQYKAVIKSIDSKTVTTKVVEKQKSNNTLGLNLILAQAVLKTDAQNLVIQKATELGVKKIVPMITENCVIKASVIDSKREKWQKIADESVKQCERVDFPIVQERMSLQEVLNCEEFNIKIVCVERETSCTLRDCLRSIDIKPSDKIAVIIGPEGGFSSQELRLLSENNQIYNVSLGKLILRAETAVVAALSNVIYELEND